MRAFTLTNNKRALLLSFSISFHVSRLLADSAFLSQDCHNTVLVIARGDAHCTFSTNLLLSHRIGAIADVERSVAHAQFVHQIESCRILREGRAPILVTRPLWTDWVENRSSRLTVGLDSADINSLCNARHQLNCDVAVAVDL